METWQAARTYSPLTGEDPTTMPVGALEDKRFPVLCVLKKIVRDRVYSRLDFYTWSFQAQAITMSRPNPSGLGLNLSLPLKLEILYAQQSGR